MTASEFSRPFPVQFTGSAAARWLLHRLGWKVRFEGLPAAQGVLAIYPHTSNWDFVILLIAKWAAGVPVRFWAKDSLFRVPLFGRWLRWLGGVPVQRTVASGMVAQADIALKTTDKTTGNMVEAVSKPGANKRV